MTRATGALALAIVLVPGLAAAEPWSRARIHALPDSAFAVVEIAPDSRKVRHLPHHDESGAVDLPHLIAPRARGGQVKWLDPANQAIAREHPDDHWRRPPSRSSPRAGPARWRDR